MLEMVLHQPAPHGPERFLHGRELHQDIGAILVSVHHALQAANLPLDAAKAAEVRRLDLRIDADRLSVRLGRTAAWGVGMSRFRL